MLKDEKIRKEAKKAKVLTLTNLHKEDEKGLALRTKKQQRRSQKYGEDEDEAKLSKAASGEEDSDEEGSDEEDSDEDEQQNVFNDEATMNMFGGEVSVVVDANPVAGQFRTDEEIFGLKGGEGGDSDNDDAGSIQSYRSRASQQGRPQHQPSRFERAMKKVKASLGTKKKNKAKELKGKARSLRKKVESKMLYEKALGRKMKRNKGK